MERFGVFEGLTESLDFIVVGFVGDYGRYREFVKHFRAEFACVNHVELIVASPGFLKEIFGFYVK